MKKLIVAAGAIAFLFGFAAAQAQESEDVVFPPHAAAFQMRMPAHGPMGADNTFEFIAAEMGMPGKVVKGAPYTAESTTESVQVLADGNRITRKSTSSIARDSEGRTRREHELPAIGPFASSGQAPKLVNIHDPVTGTSWVLDENLKTARSLQVRHLAADVLPGPGKRVMVHQDVRVMAGPGAPVEHSQVRVVRSLGAREAPKDEDLGSRTIEGLECTGTRTTVTIPAGEIGNEKEIEIVSERWVSKDLQVVVLTKHKDPQTGETTTKLTNISRAEPPRSLFEVPADYKVMEPGEAVEVNIEKKN